MRNFKTIGVPLHMVKALDKSLKYFNETGFHYEIRDRIYKESKLYFMLDATLQEAINLGIKIGYNLKAEEHAE